jgi:hypothetical protein
MQCKDIPDRPILEFLDKLNGRWATWFGNEFDNSVTHAMPPGVDNKLALAKMRKMIKRAVVKGCPCGCRGDFVITEKGKQELKNENT